MTQRELAVVVALLSITPGTRAQGATSESSTDEAPTPCEPRPAHAVRPALIYDAAGFVDMSGGARRGATYLGNLNVHLTVDMESLVCWRGAEMFFSGIWIHGGQPSDFAGDAQGVSSIEGPPKWTIEEGWIQQSLSGGRFSTLLGRYDVGSEFYRLYAADLFLNSSFGMGPEFSQSGQGGPSVFPNTSVGARFELKPVESVVLRGAVLDGVPVERPEWDFFAKGDGLLFLGEVAFLYRTPGKGQPRRLPRRSRIGRDAQLPPYEAKVAVGVWHYTARFPDLSRTLADGTAVLHRGSSGAYAIGDAIAYKDGGGRQLRVFGQLGVSDPRVNRFGLYIGGGVGLTSVLPGRMKDEVGLAVAAARNGSHFVEQQDTLGRPVNMAEVTVELAYLAPVASWLSIQPDLQYVLWPDSNPQVRNAWVGLIRVELAF